jgi:putative spermidine/putrescine transport system permease protein
MSRAAAQSSAPNGAEWQVAASLVPIGGVLGLMLGGAVLLAVAQSLGFAPWYGINSFPDPSYFAGLWESEGFWVSVGLTLYYSLAATLLALLLALTTATLLVRSFHGRAVFGALYRLPLVVPYGVGIALAVIMMGNGGLVSRGLAALGWIDDPSGFPRLLNTQAGWGVIAVYVWKQLPFMVVAIHAVMVGADREQAEAAVVLGASRWDVFRHVTLPQIAPGILSATLICFAFNMGAFEAPFILGGGYPDTLPVLAWRFFNDADYTMQLRGMAVVVSIAALTGALVLAYLAAYRAYERSIGRA